MWYEWLGQYLFDTIKEVQLFATKSLWSYNHECPIIALGGFTLHHRLPIAAALLLPTPGGITDESQCLMRASFDWRHNLKRSGNHGLHVSEWTDPDIASIGNIYRALEGHKGLASQVTNAALAAYVALLGQHMILMRCDNREGQAIALRAAVLFGNAAWDFLAAATPEARKVYASHATLWALQRACAGRGASRYDMGGADPEGNKGVFDFKRGVGAELLEYAGEWEQASNPLVRVAANAAIRRRGALA